MDASIEGFVKALGGGVGAVGGLRTNSIFFSFEMERNQNICFYFGYQLEIHIELQHGTSKQKYLWNPAPVCLNLHRKINVSAELFSTTLLYPLEVTKTKAPWLISGRQASPNMGKGTEYIIPLTYLIYFIICISQLFTNIYKSYIIFLIYDIWICMNFIEVWSPPGSSLETQHLFAAYLVHDVHWFHSAPATLGAGLCWQCYHRWRGQLGETKGLQNSRQRFWDSLIPLP